jgi:hypothetical protein
LMAAGDEIDRDEAGHQPEGTAEGSSGQCGQCQRRFGRMGIRLGDGDVLGCGEYKGNHEPQQARHRVIDRRGNGCSSAGE